MENINSRPSQAAIAAARTFLESPYQTWVEQVRSEVRSTGFRWRGPMGGGAPATAGRVETRTIPVVDSFKPGYETALEDLAKARNESRSFWRWAKSSFTSDIELAQKSEIFRNKSLDYAVAQAVSKAHNTHSRIVDDPHHIADYHDLLIETTTDHLITQYQTITNREMELNNGSRASKVVDRVREFLNKDTKRRFLIGAGVAGLGIAGAFTGVGLIAGVAVGARLIGTTLGAEAGLEGIQNFGSAKLGNRQKLTEDAVNKLGLAEGQRRLAALREYRIRKHIKEEDETENLILNRIKSLYKGALAEAFVAQEPKIMGGKEEDTQALIKGIITEGIYKVGDKDSSLDTRLDNTLKASRNITAARWAAASVIGAGTALWRPAGLPTPNLSFSLPNPFDGVGGKIHELTGLGLGEAAAPGAPAAPAPAPGANGDTIPYEFRNPDEYVGGIIKKVTGKDTFGMVSSIQGFSEAQVAIHELGINPELQKLGLGNEFNPNDLRLDPNGEIDLATGKVKTIGQKHMDVFNRLFHGYDKNGLGTGVDKAISTRNAAKAKSLMEKIYQATDKGFFLPQDPRIGNDYLFTHMNYQGRANYLDWCAQNRANDGCGFNPLRIPKNMRAVWNGVVDYTQPRPTPIRPENLFDIPNWEPNQDPIAA